MLTMVSCYQTGISMAMPLPGLSHEQVENYKSHDLSIVKIVNIAFPDITAEQRRLWRMLLLGTLAVETNFMNRYSGRSGNGNGPYQITGDTAYGIIHGYITYPLKGADIIRVRKKLIPLFEKATDGRLHWRQLYNMDKDDLIELCVIDHDLAALMSLLVYKDAFGRNNIDELPPDIPGLALLWKRYYNTVFGVGTEERFMERFMLLREDYERLSRK
jgi:hypothetical protein